MMAQEDLSVGILMKLFQKKKCFLGVHTWTWEPLAMSNMCNTFKLFSSFALSHRTVHDFCVFFSSCGEEDIINITFSFSRDRMSKAPMKANFQFFHNDIFVLLCFFALMAFYPLLRLTAESRPPLFASNDQHA